MYKHTPCTILNSYNALLSKTTLIKNSTLNSGKLAGGLTVETLLTLLKIHFMLITRTHPILLIIIIKTLLTTMVTKRIAIRT